jgi:hypothetical protein
MSSDDPELSVSVRLWDALLAPTMVFPNVRVAVERVPMICGGGGGLPLPPPHPA